MLDWVEVAAVIGLFALRVAIPVAITLGVCLLLRRLDAHWQAQANAASIAQQTAPPTVAAVPAVPCWVTKNCPESRRLRCPAHQQPSMACWLVRLRRDGRLPGGCPGCAIFKAHVAAREAVPA